MKAIGLFVAAFLLLFQVIGRAEAPVPAPSSALKFFKNYFVTGDYVVGGVGLRGTGTGGIATGTIDMTGADMPAGVDVLAAFLYWETVDLEKNGGQLTGAKFKGNDISTLAVQLNPAGTAPCWSSGGGTGSPDGAHKMFAYRADVLRFLEPGPDGKLLVKTTHEVQLPDAGSGNVVPSTAGASLAVVYRDQSKPLTAIVLYDGGYTMDQTTNSMNQQLSGFYQAASGAGKLTHIVGDGQPNFSERLLFNNGLVTTNPFVGALGPASDPAWDSPTFPLSSTTTLTDPASTTVDHLGITPFDCLSWGAVIFSTAVQDTDGDGLLDIWETSSSLSDPTGQPLPNLKAMGADPNVKDMFIEIGYLETAGETSNPLQGVMPKHDHMPSKNALDMVGNAFANAPVTNPDPKVKGIRVHFDVGNKIGYQTTPPDPYIIPAAAARGGESAPEVSCTPTATRPCQFKDFTGTVGWKSAYRFYRDQPLNYPSEQACVAAGSACNRRFDRNRKDIFHYALFAHAIGLPRSNDPASPLNHVPANTSGIADLVGGDILVTLGFWHHYLATDTDVPSANSTDYMQAATLMHELGHNLSLRHWGGPQTFKDGQPQEFNCKPNYLSVMNYLFQARGLLTKTGISVLDYSRQPLPAVDPNQVSEPLPFGSALTLPYLTRWYSPKATSFIDTTLGTTPATRHCNGSPITEGVDWVRVDGTSVVAPIDWNANGLLNDTAYPQDVSFNGIKVNSKFPVLNASVNDWNLIDLRQIGGRRNVGSKRIGGSQSLDVGYGDVGYGDVGYGDVGYGDVGYGDVGYGDVGYGDVGYGDVGYGDVGYGDVGYGDVGAPIGDMDLDTAISLGNAPDSLTAVNGKNVVNLSWAPPHVDAVNYYTLYRVLGAGITPANLPGRVTVATPASPATTAIDATAKNNTTYTYFVVAQFYNGTQSGISNLATITVK